MFIQRYKADLQNKANLQITRQTKFENPDLTTQERSSKEDNGTTEKSNPLAQLKKLTKSNKSSATKSNSNKQFQKVNRTAQLRRPFAESARNNSSESKVDKMRPEANLSGTSTQQSVSSWATMKNSNDSVKTESSSGESFDSSIDDEEAGIAIRRFWCSAESNDIVDLEVNPVPLNATERVLLNADPNQVGPSLQDYLNEACLIGEAAVSTRHNLILATNGTYQSADVKCLLACWDLAKEVNSSEEIDTAFDKDIENVCSALNYAPISDALRDELRHAVYLGDGKRLTQALRGIVRYLAWTPHVSSVWTAFKEQAVSASDASTAKSTRSWPGSIFTRRKDVKKAKQEAKFAKQVLDELATRKQQDLEMRDVIKDEPVVIRQINEHVSTIEFPSLTELSGSLKAPVFNDKASSESVRRDYAKSQEDSEDEDSAKSRSSIDPRT